MFLSLSLSLSLSHTHTICLRVYVCFIPTPILLLICLLCSRSSSMYCKRVLPPSSPTMGIPPCQFLATHCRQGTRHMLTCPLWKVLYRMMKIPAGEEIHTDLHFWLQAHLLQFWTIHGGQVETCPSCLAKEAVCSVLDVIGPAHLLQMPPVPTRCIAVSWLSKCRNTPLSSLPRAR
jgi:hypothetical protein